MGTFGVEIKVGIKIKISRYVRIRYITSVLRTIGLYIDKEKVR